ncbi:MAG: hypothetical protein H6732_19135 [Alphaproteobacteria bacterium]|nr:hypothetical protein [Alphaproteobacteria bacterium]
MLPFRPLPVRLLAVASVLATGLACDALFPPEQRAPFEDPDAGKGRDTSDTSDSGGRIGRDDQTPNQPPRAVIVRPRSDLVVGDDVVLDGTPSTDPDDDPLTWAWELTEKPTGSKASILNASRSIGDLSFDRAGRYVVRLTVDDGRANDSADVALNVATGNRRPTADAGLDQSVTVNTTVYLSGAGSTDPDGDELEYHWTARGPTGSISLNGASNPGTAVSPSFYAAAVGFYTITLEVDDGELRSDPDTVTVTVRDSTSSSSNAGGVGGSSSSGGCSDCATDCAEPVAQAEAAFTAGDLAGSGGLLVLPILVALGYRRRDD